MAKAGVRGRPIAPLILTAQERAYLERQVRRHRVAQSLSERCRVTTKPVAQRPLTWQVSDSPCSHVGLPRLYAGREGLTDYPVLAAI
jgi:hypothetical protein